MTDRRCSVEGCERQRHVASPPLCKMHYIRLTRHGDVGPPHSLMDPEVRFRKFAVPDPSGCWLWNGRLNRGGYGLFSAHRTRIAHRWAYEWFVGPIPDGMEIDHLCRVPRCVNPAHLEPVTPLENQRRRSLAQTHCKRGHDLALAYVNARGARDCRQCAALRRRAFRERKVSRERQDEAAAAGMPKGIAS